MGILRETLGGLAIANERPPQLILRGCKYRTCKLHPGETRCSILRERRP
jgi:hypothetical protein